MSNLHLCNKFLKGIFGLLSLNLLVIVIVYVFNSCQGNQEEGIGKNAAANFLSVLESNKDLIGSTAVNVVSGTQGLRNSVNNNDLSANTQTVYLSISQPATEDIQKKAENIKSIQGLSDFISETQAVVQYEPRPFKPVEDYMVYIPLDYIRSLLASFTEAAIEYLKSKGFTDLDIKEMLTENEAEDVELVLFAMVLSHYETQENIALTKTNNLLSPVSQFFVNDVSARPLVYQDYVGCALSAIGLDVFFALGGSSAASWSIPMMKKAFSAVAKRALGPIGVAIAVVSFGMCIGGLDVWA